MIGTDKQLPLPHYSRPRELCTEPFLTADRRRVERAHLDQAHKIREKLLTSREQCCFLKLEKRRIDAHTELDRHNVFDFVGFLKQKRASGVSKPGNIAERIHRRFAVLDTENIPFP
ncbi:MAG: hypothetical protein WBP54_13240 [Pelodictyon phaeoclathratiforme]